MRPPQPQDNHTISTHTTMSAQYELDEPPTDAISSVQFSPSSQNLIAASWDRTLSVYSRTEGSSKPFTLQKRIHCRAPVLDVCWGADESTVYFVGLDHDVRRLDLISEEQSVLSTHEQASNKIAYSHELGLVISTGWDSILHAHDVASANGRSHIRVQLPGKPFALDLTAERAVVAMAERKVSVYDIASFKALSEQAPSAQASNGDSLPIHEVMPWQTRESNLKFMTRSIATMPDGTGFATSSIEGRVAVEWFDAEKAANTYAFKCHRQTTTQTAEDGEEQEVDVVYPVNAITFNNHHGTFATGGGDGVIAFWDAQSKRRVKQYPTQAASVAALHFSADGRFLAAAVSPGFEDGNEEAETNQELVQVVVRELTENEAKGKAAK
jgi:cell cycle arrest protein BUB3